MIEQKRDRALPLTTVETAQDLPPQIQENINNPLPNIFK